MTQAARVHLWYPPDDRPDDEEWLAAAAARHGGELDRAIMLSQPAQRFCRFSEPSAASAFVEELNATGRWQANV